MDGQAIVSVSAAVTALTQIIKWGGLPDKLGPISVLILSLMGVGVWGWSEGTFERTQAFAYFAGWIAVSTSAAGIFGFTRAASTSLTKATAPPAGGAGSSGTLKDN